MQPYLRDAVRDDLPAIAAILRDAAAEPTEAHHRAGGRAAGRAERGDDADAGAHAYREALAEIDRTDGTYVLVAEIDGAIAGFCQLVTYRHLHARGGRTGELVAVRVGAAFCDRDRDVAGLLVSHAAARARDLGCRRLRIDGAVAHRLDDGRWELLGFSPAGPAQERTLMTGSDHSGRIRRRAAIDATVHDTDDADDATVHDAVVDAVVDAAGRHGDPGPR